MPIKPRWALLVFLLLQSFAVFGHAHLKSLPDDDSYEGFEKVPFSVWLRKFRSELQNFSEPQYSEEQKSQILKNYNHLDPQREISTLLLEKAVLYYHWNLSSITNKNYLTLIDFGKYSASKRFFVVDMTKGTVWSTRAAHGEGSDADDDGYAEKFVNILHSNSTSLGAYLTAETYISDKNGLSMRLDGLALTNSRARERAVVFHGANYIQDKNVKPGRSWGCPAIPMDQRTKVIAWIQGGSILYAGKD